MKLLVLSSETMEPAVTSVLAKLNNVELDILPMTQGRFPHTPHDRLIVEQEHVNAVSRRGFHDVDAIYLDTFGDYGCAALRSLTGLPVFGAGESSLTVARTLAPRFAIVTVWPERLRFIYAERLRAARAEDACAGIIHVGAADDSVSSILTDTHTAADQALDRILSKAHDAIARLDVDAILLGCTCMAALYDRLSAALPVPVICPSRSGLGFAIGAAACGWRQSPRLAPGNEEGRSGQSCPVCVDWSDKKG